MKEKLTNLFGSVGVFFYFIIRFFVAAFPFIMIEGSFWFIFLLISIEQLFPFTYIIFWIWGLLDAIKGTQDIWAILYYGVFGFIFIPFFVDLIKAFLPCHSFSDFMLKIKKGIVGYIIGVPLIVIQYLGVVGTTYSGSAPPVLSFESVELFFLHLAVCIGYYHLGILGAFFIWLGWLAGFKKDKKHKIKNNIPAKFSSDSLDSEPSHAEYVGKYQSDYVSNEKTYRQKGQIYCKYCGGAIDTETKKCTKCEKQYFRLKINWKLAFCMIITSLAIATAVISQYRISEHLKDISSLTLLNSTMQDQIEDLEANIYNKNIRITNLENQVEGKNDQIRRLIREKQDIQDKVDFYDKNIVFVLDDGSNAYHRYDCVVFQHSDKQYWAYNIELAQYRGYRSCYLCD